MSPIEILESMHDLLSELEALETPIPYPVELLQCKTDASDANRMQLTIAIRDPEIVQRLIDSGVLPIDAFDRNTGKQ